MTLVEDLTFWRAERPSEWVIDRFIQKAKELEENEFVLVKYWLQETMESGRWVQQGMKRKSTEQFLTTVEQGEIVC
jgi:hypothetical protein